MLDSNLGEGLPAKIRTLQVLAAALIMGVVIFAVIALIAGAANTAAGSAPTTAQMTLDVLRVVGGATMLAGVVMSIVLARKQSRIPASPLIGNRSESQVHSQDEQLFSRFFVNTIIIFALFEGGGLLAGIVLLLSGRAIDLIFVAVPVLIMLVQFPTVGKWRRFVEHAQRDEFHFTQR